MRERPILFSAPMVRALLDGTKTQTRRVVKHRWPHLWQEPWYATGKVLADLPNQPGAFMEFRFRAQDTPNYLDSPASTLVPCPYGQPGDVLRVKESAWMWCERRPNGKTPTGRDKWRYVPMRDAPVLYAADHPTKPVTSVVSPDTGNAWGWRLKIGRFLPAWASRIALELTGVRVEHLQDISVTGALAEGIEKAHVDGLGRQRWHFYQHDDGVPGEDVARYCGPLHTLHPCESFRSLWLSINGPGSWAANPWVWVVEFRRVMP